MNFNMDKPWTQKIANTYNKINKSTNNQSNTNNNAYIHTHIYLNKSNKIINIMWIQNANNSAGDDYR